MTALEYFRLLAPEFAATPDETVNIWFTATEEDSAAASACLSTEGQAKAKALYAAHLMRVTQTQASGGAALGPVKSEKEGDLSRTYGVVANDNTWLGQTPYGQQYMNLTGPCSGLGIMTRVNIAS